MSRPARLLAALLSVALLPIAPALAVVNITGDVKPIEPPNPFGLPFGAAGSDEDGDGVPDYIDSDGNNLLLPSNPNNPATWLETTVWVDYDSTQNILVGETAYGLLEINGRTKLRYQHVVLGGSADGDLDLTTLGGSTGADSFDFTQDLMDAASPGTIDVGPGFGDMLVSGTDTVFNNDPNVIGAGEQAAINFSLNQPASTPVVDLSSLTFTGGTGDPTLRQVDGTDGFDMYVGFLSSGRLTVNTGGRVEIQDSLMAAVSSGVTGDVFVDGVGTYLAAYGRAELDSADLMSMSPTQRATTSFIGGAGDGTLEVTNGARTDFFGGLSIGAATGEAFTALGGAGSGGTGRVTVMGDTSVATLTAYSSANTVSNFSFDGQRLALAVGEIRFGDALTDPLSPGESNQDFGRGELEIGEGGRVVTTSSSTYQDTIAADSRAYVGRNGVVRMRGGDFLIATNLINDGEINGYGLVQAETIDTSDNSVITGGDPNANIASAVSEELRLEVTGGPAGAADFAFVNRGLVNGLVDVDVDGRIRNGVDDPAPDERFEGIVETAGIIRAVSLVNSFGSRITGVADASGPLRIRLSDDQSAGIGVGGGPDRGALHNRGVIAGVVDIVAEGGLVNGDVILGSDPSGTSNGGAITASGTIVAGSFVNNPLADVRVGPGQSLTIYATAATADTIEFGAGIPITGGGSTLAFRQLNLGLINVDDGELVVGYTTPDELEEVIDNPMPGVFFTEEAFFNARYAEAAGAPTFDDSEVGTIVVNDGTLVFESGLVNTGNVAFTGGDNVVSGDVFNFSVDYDADTFTDFPGVIVVSGNGTTVTFEDEVVNFGEIAIGPDGNVVNFLGGLDNSGGLVTVSLGTGFTGTPSSIINVGTTVTINAGSLTVLGTVLDENGFPILATAPDGVALATHAAGEVVFSQVLIDAAGGIAEGSLFTEIDLPEITTDNLFWDLVFDMELGQIRADLVMSTALGADFNGDGVVDESDLAIWTRNAGINSGASLLMGDADLDGDVDLADYDLLSSQLLTGIPVSVGGGPLALANSGAIPEPTTAMLALLASLACYTRCR